MFEQTKPRNIESIIRDYNSKVVNALEVSNDVFSRIYKTDYNTDYFSLAAWKGRAQEVRKLILEHKATGDKQKAALEGIYAGEALKTVTGNIDSEHANMVDKARDIITRDFRFVMGEKKMAHGMALFAPTEAQVRLLNVLNQRTAIEADELTAAADVCSDNLQALRLLAEIAKKHDIYFPALPTETDFNRAVDTLEEIAAIIVDDCTVDDNKIGYAEKVLWNTDSWGAAASAAQQIDSPVYLRIDEPNTQQDGHIKITSNAKGY